jgi:hypothetical protein
MVVTLPAAIEVLRLATRTKTSLSTAEYIINDYFSQSCSPWHLVRPLALPPVASPTK